MAQHFYSFETVFWSYSCFFYLVLISIYSVQVETKNWVKKHSPFSVRDTRSWNRISSHFTMTSQQPIRVSDLLLSPSYILAIFHPPLLLFLFRSSLYFTSTIAIISQIVSFSSFSHLLQHLPLIMQMDWSFKVRWDHSPSQKLPCSSFSLAWLPQICVNQPAKVALGLFSNRFLPKLSALVNSQPTNPQIFPWLYAFISRVTTLKIECSHSCFLTLLIIKIWTEML